MAGWRDGGEGGVLHAKYCTRGEGTANEDVGHYCQARECGRDAEGQHMEEQRADGKA